VVLIGCREVERLHRVPAHLRGAQQQRIKIKFGSYDLKWVQIFSHSVLLRMTKKTQIQFKLVPLHRIYSATNPPFTPIHAMHERPINRPGKEAVQG
jgi:hypothetical protein